ncbi:estradiol 17-beta-dehydrogenase 1 isoform X5 [Zalophus californianus]|uniref:Estradiol 17-beta-dehydrogenase 1 isoform X5 n=1 Tax=Zalophus californianus TaxID=9704 RepID=A0A6J2FR50_ZALCA|nr:estradiol 17-beta-dehydrogenase 1 isoform X5 [Zalophus californianus]
MDRTVVLITGCSSGIGLHLALRLASDPSRSFKDPHLLPEPPVYATLRDLRAQGPLWEAARARGCPPGSLETLQLDVRDADSVAAARARVTEGRVDVLGEPPRNTCAGAFPTLCPNQNVPRPRDLLGPRTERQAGPDFSPHSVQCRAGPAWAAGGAYGWRRGVSAGRERDRDGADTAGLPARHEAPPLRTYTGDRQHGRFDGAAVQRRLLRQQVRDRRSLRESGGSAAALRGPRHLERIFREAAQDPEEVTEVFAVSLDNLI